MKNPREAFRVSEKLDPNVIKLFMSVILKFLQQAKMFVPGNPFQPILMQEVNLE